MNKSNKSIPKILCERYIKHVRAFNNFDKNDCRPVKKVIVSKKTFQSPGTKSYSTGLLNSKAGSRMKTPKKTAKSDVIFSDNLTPNRLNDYCKKCGDADSHGEINTKPVTNTLTNRLKNTKTQNSSTHKHCNNIMRIQNKGKDAKPIQQYYKNENFHQSSDSVYAADNTKKASLNTILEENASTSESEMIEFYTDDLPEELGYLDTNNIDNLQELKDFRKKNYFECHSAKSRIDSTTSITDIKNHQCVYRFYLNERLFPVPVSTDYQDNVRCIECNLPLENNYKNSKINGTIQAKVKLNGKIQDVVLMLPVKKYLIVEERRKVLQNKKDYDYLYFGIIKLDLKGDSVFNRNLPSDSLALRYQKGYKDLSKNIKYEYDGIGKNDVIFV